LTEQRAFGNAARSFDPVANFFAQGEVGIGNAHRRRSRRGERPYFPGLLMPTAIKPPRSLNIGRSSVDQPRTAHLMCGNLVGDALEKFAPHIMR
jgi:hypothetical protein